jgi:hypothetical protein
MKYLLGIYGDEKVWDTFPPEQQGKEFAKYNEYSQWLRDQGLYVGGDALAGTDQATTVQAHDGKTTTTDGPFAETKEQLGGYYVIEVPDLDKALEWAARCPAASTGAVEVRPNLSM